jgi:D-alanine--poly(phosphoribitol) ligase subunit 1
VGAIARAQASALRSHELPITDNNRSVYSYLRQHAADRPDAACVYHAGTVTTYRELLQLTDTIAAQLDKAGCIAGDRVAVAVGRGKLSVASLLAIESIGATYVPLEPEWPAERYRAVLNSAGCRCTLVDEQVCKSPDAKALETARETGAAVLVVPDRPSWNLDRPPVRTPNPDEARYIIYTSGSSGKPKGVVVTQLGMGSHIRAMVTLLALTPDDVVAFSAAPSYVISVWQLTAAIMAGGAIAVVDQEALGFPRRLVGEVARAGITIMQLVPATLDALLTSIPAPSPATRLRSLRVLLSTGAPVRSELLNKVATVIPGAQLRNAYGATECSDDFAHHVLPSSGSHGTWVPAGRPLPGAVGYLLARHDDGWDAAKAGETGELFVGGAGVAAGYVDDRSGQAETFFHDPFDPASPTGRLYRTGDLALFDGVRIHCLGRRDRQVKVLGVRVELDEIEAAASRMAGVSSAAAVLSAERIWLFYQSDKVASAAMREHLRRLLPPGAVPSELVRLQAIPRTASGKADYERLSDSVRSGR